MADKPSKKDIGFRTTKDGKTEAFDKRTGKSLGLITGMGDKPIKKKGK